jgi:hypothetical protein
MLGPDRKKSKVKGFGIQYLPFHQEGFVDYIIKNFDKEKNEILEIAGGGLRFSSKIKKARIIVNDLDVSSLHAIKKKFNLKNKINFLKGDFFTVNKKLKKKFDLIVSFRFIHFFNEKKLNIFFKLASFFLKKNGYLVISSFFYDKRNKNSLEIINSSKPINLKNPYFRIIKKNTKKGKYFIDEMNLNSKIFLVRKNFLNSMAKKYSLRLLDKSYYSTRIVRGYILKKI